MQRRIGKGLGFEDIDLRIYDAFIKKRETIRKRDNYFNMYYTYARTGE